MENYYLYPGDVFATKQPHLVNTILGSCIAVALWDSVLQVGGINHYMLPHWNEEGKPSAKYGDIAIGQLIKKMLNLGCAKSNLRAKIFGGSETGVPNGVFHIGERNTTLAVELLKTEQIPLVSNSVGGVLGRKLVFYTQTGEVRIKYIKNGVNDDRNKTFKA